MAGLHQRGPDSAHFSLGPLGRRLGRPLAETAADLLDASGLSGFGLTPGLAGASRSGSALATAAGDGGDRPGYRH